MAKKKGKKSNNTALFVILAIIAIIVIVAIIVIFVVNPGGIKDKIMNVINGQKSNTNTNSGGSQNQSNLAHGEGELQFHMLDVGQGDWLLVLLPDGKDMIIDAGNVSGKAATYTTGKQYMDQYITDGQIDYVIATHSDTDHIVFMDEIFRDYQVSNLYMPAIIPQVDDESINNRIANIPAEKRNIIENSGIDKTKCYVTTKTYAEFYIAALSEPNCNIFLNLEINADNNDATLDANSIITSSDNTYSMTFFFENLEFYNKKKFAGDGHQINGISPTMILEYNGKRIVFTGDANQENEPDMIDRMNAYYGGVIDCDVLKVAHHGSHEGSSNAYLDEVICEYAMVSCNKAGNTFKHPRQVTLDRLKAHNITLYRTDLHGTIVCVIDKDGNITITPTNANVSSTDLWKGADTE